MNKLRSIEDIRDLGESLRKSQEKERISIIVCGGTGCETFGGHDIYDTFKDIVKERALRISYILKRQVVRVFAKEGLS